MPATKPDMFSVVSPVDQAKVYALADWNPIYAFGLYNLGVEGVNAVHPEADDQSE